MCIVKAVSVLVMVLRLLICLVNDWSITTRRWLGLILLSLT